MSQEKPFRDDNTEGYHKEELEQLNRRYHRAKGHRTGLTIQEHKHLCEKVQARFDTMLAQTEHDDYEAAFQAAEHICQERMRVGVDPVPAATPNVDGFHTWAFTPSGPSQIPDALRGKVERVEVRMDLADPDVYLTRGPLEDPEILETRTVDGGGA